MNSEIRSDWKVASKQGELENSKRIKNSIS